MAVRIERERHTKMTTACSERKVTSPTDSAGLKSVGESKVRFSSIWLSRPNKRARKCVKCESIKPSLEE